MTGHMLCMQKVICMLLRISINRLNDPCRNTNRNGIIRNILRDNGTAANNTVRSDGYTGHDNGVDSNMNIITDGDPTKRSISLHSSFNCRRTQTPSSWVISFTPVVIRTWFPTETRYGSEPKDADEYISQFSPIFAPCFLQYCIGCLRI